MEYPWIFSPIGMVIIYSLHALMLLILLGILFFAIRSLLYDFRDDKRMKKEMKKNKIEVAY